MSDEGKMNARLTELVRPVWDETICRGCGCGEEDGRRADCVGDYCGMRGRRLTEMLRENRADADIDFAEPEGFVRLLEWVRQYYLVTIGAGSDVVLVELRANDDPDGPPCVESTDPSNPAVALRAAVYEAVRKGLLKVTPNDSMTWICHRCLKSFDQAFTGKFGVCPYCTPAFIARLEGDLAAAVSRAEKAEAELRDATAQRDAVVVQRDSYQRAWDNGLRARADLEGFAVALINDSLSRLDAAVAERDKLRAFANDIIDLADEHPEVADIEISHVARNHGLVDSDKVAVRYVRTPLLTGEGGNG